jgi:hypothetical protein
MASIEIPFHLDVRAPQPEVMEQVRQIFLEEMTAAVKDCVLHVHERVKRIIEDREASHGDLINEGHLINSIATAMGLRGNVIEGQVGTNLDYAKYPEFGTVPHFVPFHMAKSLYNEAIGDWGWIPVTKAERRFLGAQPDKAVRTQGALKLVTGRVRTYVVNDTQKLWAKPAPDARPVWGVWVSGRKRPYLYPGWVESLGFITARLEEGGRRAAGRINQGQ